LVDDLGRSLAASRGISNIWKVPSAFNATLFMLIPKEERVTHTKQLYPISLCNEIYKIITKVIALRLKPLFPFIIFKEKSGCVEGRQIMGSVILAHEVIHSLNTTHNPCMFIKLDLSKYFDRISLKCMRSLLEAYGFDTS
jgi:hypothetical protein